MNSGTNVTQSPLPLLSAVNLHKTYVTGEARVTALAGVSLTLEPGEFRRA